MLLQLVQCPTFVLYVRSKLRELLNDGIKIQPDWLVRPQCCCTPSQLLFCVSNWLVQLGPSSHRPTNTISTHRGRTSYLHTFHGPLPLSFLPVPSLPPPILPFPSVPLEVETQPLNTAGDLEECCKLPQKGLGWSPSGNQIWCILASKSDIWWHQFY